MQLEYPIYKGFLIIKEDLNLDGFNKEKINENTKLLVSEDYDYHTVHSSESTVWLLGYLHDIRNNQRTIPDILKHLAGLSIGDALYDELEYLNGRYSLIIKKSGSAYIYSDASNMRPMFYNRDFSVIGTHEYIVNEYIKQVHGKYLSTREINKGEADWTNYKTIFKFSPSVELEINDFQFKRIFPRSERKEQPPEVALDEITQYIDQIVSWLKQHDNLKSSLTGGADSRLTLAILKPIVPNIKFFTYLKREDELANSNMRESYSNDERIVGDMAYNLNLAHEFFTIPDTYKGNEEYPQMMKETMSSVHSYKLSYYLNSRGDFKNSLHIKSTVSSVGKSSFDKILYNENTLESLMSGFKKWLPDGLREKSNADQYKKEIQSYLNRTKIDMDDLKGYHILDILFLESRLGNFQSNITQETDNTLELFNPFNSRKMIGLLLSVPLQDRQNEVLSKLIIDYYWSILNQFSLNAAPGTVEKLNFMIAAMDNGIARAFYAKNKLLECTSVNLGLSKVDNDLVIEPMESPLLSEKEYYYQMINMSGGNKSVKISSSYDNPKGKGVILTRIQGIERDLLDINKGVQVELKNNEMLNISLLIQESKTNASWRKAARLTIEV